MNGSIQVTILGCGSSGGVPRIGNDWGACDPDNPRNRRRRCSVLVARGATRVLVDTSPDLREQLLAADVGELDGVIFTHDHADQSHGIDDLRVVALRMRSRIRAFADTATAETLSMRFGYCFQEPFKNAGYPPILEMNLINGPFEIDGAGGEVPVIPFTQVHGRITSLGFRFGGVAYSSDVSELPEESFEALDGVDTWIVDALRYTPHNSHAHVERALEWIARIKPRRAVLTNLHTDLDYETLRGELPDGVEPAYDGMVVEVPIAT